MTQVEDFIAKTAADAILKLYGVEINRNELQIQPTRKEFAGDVTLVVFPLIRLSKKGPDDTGKEIGIMLKTLHPEIESFKVVKGFLNLSFSNSFWLRILKSISETEDFGSQPTESKHRFIMVELFFSQYQ